MRGEGEEDYPSILLRPTSQRAFIQDLYGNNVTQGDSANMKVTVSWVNGSALAYTRTDVAAALTEAIIFSAPPADH